MGRPKKEMKKIHRKKLKIAKRKTKAYLKGDLTINQLSQLAKSKLARKKKAEKKRQS